MKYELVYDMIGAGPVGHPQEMFEKFLHVLNNNRLPPIPEAEKLQLISCECRSIGDVWIFECEGPEDFKFGYLPCYIKVEKK